MTVWVVMVHYDYEGAELVGLYKSFYGAHNRMLAETPDEDEYPWEASTIDGWWRRRRGQTTYSVHEVEVIP